MTILSSSDESYTLTAAASIVIDEEDVASSWASKHITSSPSLKWIVGKYVEADNANRNGQYWTLEDLRMNAVTINHAPMNIGHNKQNPVGTYVAAEMIYPSEAGQNAFIETAAAMWRRTFPAEFGVVNKAFREGSLFQSMECYADTVTCVGSEAACGNTYPYKGPYSDTYCDHIRLRQSAHQFNNTTFTGGGLIVPPNRPGWANAEIEDVAQITEGEGAEEVYNQVAKEAPHLSPSQWESIMQIIQLKDAARSNNSEDAETAGRLLGIAVASALYS